MRSLLLACGLALLGGEVQGQMRDVHKRTRTIQLTETAGIARMKAPVEVTLRFEQAAWKDAGLLRLLRVEGERKTPIPCQVLDVASHTATDSFASAPQTFVQVVFLADVPANGTVRYEVALGGPAAAAPAESLAVSGDGVGRAVDTQAVRFDFHARSGQLLSCTPTRNADDRLVFQQFKDKPLNPIHWNPDIWAVGAPWGHTNSWNAPLAADASKQPSDVPPDAGDKARPYYYRDANGPLAYRLTRWGQMPYVPQAVASVSYTCYAGAPFMRVQSLVEIRAGLAVHAIRNAELVFSRHQFDTAVWLTKDGKLHHVPAYDYEQKDRSFGAIAKLPPDVPLLGFANEKKGFGVALVVLSMTNLNKFSGQAADEQAHFYIRDYDEHGKGSPANFLYLVRPVVYRENYLPTNVRAGSLYAEQSAVVVFRLQPDPARRYEELLRWQKILTQPLEIVVD